ncbi:hypothetical protein CRUP_012901 [Coryphaenoides rupestris]|nr:hypothetical protein CRUP_012901 [Coryphaenoides rupestris]
MKSGVDTMQQPCAWSASGAPVLFWATPTCPVDPLSWGGDERLACGAPPGCRGHVSSRSRVATSRKMSVSYDECAGGAGADDTMDSFWEVGNYKRAVKRFDDGHRLCNDLMGCLQERAKIEKAYGDQLTGWSKRWRQLIEKVPGSVDCAPGGWRDDRGGRGELKLHQEVEGTALIEHRTWMKNGGGEERLLHQDACKEEKMAVPRDATARQKRPVTARSRTEAPIENGKYEKSLESSWGSAGLRSTWSPWRVPEHEVKRLTFLKEALLDINSHLNLQEKPRGVSSYEKTRSNSAEWSDDEQPAATRQRERRNETRSEDDSSAGKRRWWGRRRRRWRWRRRRRSGPRPRSLRLTGTGKDELTFKAGDELTKTEDEDDQGWCRGRLDTGKEGLYPANYVEPI